jgi:osmotically-inducible protein OsmY
LRPGTSLLFPAYRLFRFFVVHTLDRNVDIPSDNIKVTVEEGVVTLEGRVDLPFQKALAESTVKDLKGVIGVNNLIKVRQAASPK